MEAMGRLAAGIAHDLNNILSGLVSYPELLLLDIPKDDPIRSKIQTIQRAGQRAADIVQDLLMISRRSVKSHVPIHLNDVIEAYLESPEFKRLEKCNPCIHFETKLDQGLMRIKGSAVHMSKVLMNLVGNAAEAMPAGGIIVIGTRNQYLDDAVEGYERIPEGEYVLMSVTDDGVGIPADALHRIFEPFYSKKRLGHSGSGLGMTVVWNTVKEHDGFLNIHSQDGRGSRFEIYLPATRKEEGPKTEADAVLEDYTGTERILVVDDAAEQREIATSMLKRLGYQVSAVASGEAALLLSGKPGGRSRTSGHGHAPRHRRLGHLSPHSSDPPRPESRDRLRLRRQRTRAGHARLGRRRVHPQALHPKEDRAGHSAGTG